MVNQSRPDSIGQRRVFRRLPKTLGENIARRVALRYRCHTLLHLCHFFSLKTTESVSLIFIGAIFQVHEYLSIIGHFFLHLGHILMLSVPINCVKQKVSSVPKLFLFLITAIEQLHRCHHHYLSSVSRKMFISVK